MKFPPVIFGVFILIVSVAAFGRKCESSKKCPPNVQFEKCVAEFPNCDRCECDCILGYYRFTNDTCVPYKNCQNDSECGNHGSCSTRQHSVCVCNAEFQLSDESGPDYPCRPIRPISYRIITVIIVSFGILMFTFVAVFSVHFWLRTRTRRLSSRGNVDFIEEREETNRGYSDLDGESQRV